VCGLVVVVWFVVGVCCVVALYVRRKRRFVDQSPRNSKSPLAPLFSLFCVEFHTAPEGLASVEGDKLVAMQVLQAKQRYFAITSFQ
jgi:hypothetical protein